MRALTSINTNSCSCLGTSSTALSKVVQKACLLQAYCVSVGAYATTNVTALARPRSSSVSFILTAQLRASHPPPSSVRFAWQLWSPVHAHVLDFSFRSVTEGAALLCLAASFCAPTLLSYLWHFLSFPFPCPRSCLLFWSLDVDSAVPPRVAPPISRLQGESGAHSQAPLLPSAFRGGAPVLVPWPLVRTVWLVDSNDSAPPTPSAMPLADHSTPGLITVSSLPRFGSTPPGRQPRNIDLCENSTARTPSTTVACAASRLRYV